MADCDASLRGERIAATLDSRAFVLLRLNRNQEAKAAFDEALSVDPKLAPSLYGRSLAERRLGDPAADKDKAAALDSNPNIVKTYADYGVTR